MGRRRHSADESVNKLRQAEVELGKGKTITEVCKHFGVSERPRHSCDGPGGQAHRSNPASLDGGL